MSKETFKSRLFLRHITNRSSSLWLVLSLSFLFVSETGCKKKDVDSETTSKDLILNKNLIVVSNSPLSAYLETVSEQKIVFKKGIPEVEKIKEGSILVSDTSGKAPWGFLRKVESINQNATTKTFYTSNASLVDAIDKGKVHFEHDFSDADILNIDSSGVDIAANFKVGDAQTFSFTKKFDQLIYDLDNKPSTKDDQVRLKGEFNLESKLIFDLDIDYGAIKVKKFSLIHQFKNKSKVELSSTVGLPKLNKEWPIYTYEIQPIRFFIGPVPVVLTNWLVLVGGFDGNISAKLSAGVTNDYSTDLGIEYIDGKWNHVQDHKNNFSANFMNSVGVVGVEPWVQLRYEMRPYGVEQMRFNLGAKGSLLAQATISDNKINWDLSWGIKFNGLAQMDLFDRNILKYDATFYEKQYKIATGTAALCDGSLSLNCGTYQGGNSSTFPKTVSVPACGGSPPYQYKINNGDWQSSSQFSLPSPSVYIFTVKDSRGCTASRTLNYTPVGG